MLKICTLAQRLTHCYCSIITNLIVAKTEWKRQHITQQIKLFDYWGTYCKCSHHMTHIINVNVCNSQSTVQHAQHWRWRIMQNSLMTTSCHVYFVGHLLKKKKLGWVAANCKVCNLMVLLSQRTYWWEEFRAYLICKQHGNFHTCHRPTLLLLCTWTS